MKVIFFFFLILIACHAYASSSIKQKLNLLKKKSSNILQDIVVIKNKTIRIAQYIIIQEKKITFLQKKMFFLKKQLLIKKGNFQQAQLHLFQIFSGLQTISNFSIECFLINPRNPDQMILATMLLASLPKIFRKKIFQLKKELKDLIVLENKTNQTYKKMQKTLNVIYLKSLFLNQTLDNLKKLEKKTQNKQQHLQCLTQLINKFSSVQSMIHDIKNLSYLHITGKTSFQMPVNGRILIFFHQKTVFKRVTSDITISASPGSIVLTPGSGIIMFAGNFQNHGLIIIIKHAHDYYSVLTGMTKILVHTGEHVLKGQPIAYLGQVILDPIIAFQQDVKNNPILHYKLLKNGKPVNPIHYM